MKAVIFAGGRGTRLSEETHSRPKPMVEIGGMPILWHIMKIYEAHGINDFIICCGYKGALIKEFFINYSKSRSDLTIDLSSGEAFIHHDHCEPWRVTLLDTGLDTETGGRLLRIRDHIEDESFVFLTYGDGLADVDLTGLLNFHQSHKKLASLTTVQPPGRFGAVETTGQRVTLFSEKIPGDGSRINGGFFVISPKCLDYIDGDEPWEIGGLVRLAEAEQLMAWEHTGFWQSMDTLREKNTLEALWQTGNPPWLSLRNKGDK